MKHTKTISRVENMARLPENAGKVSFNPFKELAEELETELVACQEILAEKHVRINTLQKRLNELDEKYEWLESNSILKDFPEPYTG